MYLNLFRAPDLVQSNHVFKPEPTFPIAHDCHTDGECVRRRKAGYPA